MKFKPSVGTITACYNAGKYFEDAFNSLLNQTYLPHVITVIDDESKDDSVKIIKQVVSSQPVVSQATFNIDELVSGSMFEILGPNEQKVGVFIFESSKNGGPAYARNIGLKFLLDKVNVIGVLDCDDYYYPEKIEKSVKVMLNNPNVGLVYSDYDIKTEKTGKITREYKEPFDLQRLLQECIVSNNSLYATSVIKAVGPYDERFRGPEDYDMWLRISESSVSYHIPESLYCYRVTGDNITITTPDNEFGNQVKLVKQKAMERLKNAKG